MEYPKIIIALGIVAVIGFVVYKMTNYDTRTPYEKAKPHLEAGETFLAENAKKPNIQSLPNGLQYEVLTPGTGLQPTIKSKVRVHYKGTLIDGTEFDSSYKRGEPATFPLSNVIPGWQQGIPLMKEGAKYRFFIPNKFAYGLDSPTPSIPPGAILIFEVELLNVLS